MVVATRAWIRKEDWSRRFSNARFPPTPSNTFAFGAIFFFVAALATWGDYFTMLRAEKSGAVLNVEGTVRNFRPAVTDKNTESFQVSRDTFTYGKYETKNGFHTLKREGSPVADGVYVRVAHLRNHILKLEVGDPR